MWTFGGGLRRFSDFLGVGVASSSVRVGVAIGVICGGWLDARSWMRDVKSRIRLVVDDGVRRFKLPDVVSSLRNAGITQTPIYY